MQAMIPDTLEGALVLSLIDFVASFVIITGIGGVLALFPLLNRIGRKREAVPVPVTAARAQAPPPSDDLPIVVIAAAVHTALAGSYRIVRIETARSGDGWVSEGRHAHHTSHHASHVRPGAGQAPVSAR